VLSVIPKSLVCNKHSDVLRMNSSETELPEDGINELCRNMLERKLLCDLMYPI